MSKKNIVFLIIIILILSTSCYYIGFNNGVQKFLNESSTISNKEVSETKLTELLESKIINISITASGTVKEALNKNITLTKLLENGEVESFLIPIKDDAKIIAKYVLPEGAPTQQIVEIITLENGEAINLGEKEINFEDIQVGDSANISLEISADGNYEGTFVRISPPADSYLK